MEQAKDVVDALAHRDPETAVARARELARYCEACPDSCVRALSLLAVANACLWSDRLEEALQAYDEACALALRGGDATLAARCGIGKIGVLFRQARYQDALELAERIEPVLARDPQGAVYAARVRSQRATLLKYLGHTEAALEAYAQAASALRACGERAALDLAVAEHNRGLLLAQAGRGREALVALEAARAAAERANSPLLAARAAAAAAWVDTAQGRYAHALRAFEAVAKRYEAARAHSTAASYRLAAVECWLFLGQAERARREGERLAAQLARGGFVAEAAQARYLTALAYRQAGAWPQAEALLQQAYHELSSVGRTGLAALAACELARCLVRRGEVNDAVRLAKVAHQGAATAQDPSGLGRARLVLADALRAAGDGNAARREAQAALREGRHRGMAWLCAAAHRRLADLAPTPGRRLAHLLCGVRWAGRVLAWAPADLRYGVFAEVGSLFEGTTVALCEAGAYERAWEVVQGAKSRGMAQLLAAQPTPFSPRRQEDAQLAEELNRALEAFRMRALASAEAPAELARTELEALHDRVQDLLWRLEVRDAAYAGDADVLGYVARPRRPALAPDAALVEYFVARGQVGAFVLDASGLRYVPRLCPEAAVARLAALLSTGLRAYADGHLPVAQALRQAELVLRGLHELLLAPVLPLLEPRRSLVVAPHGRLHGLPFHALSDGGRCVWERWEVSYVPAGWLLPHLQARPVPTARAVCVADTWGGRLPRAVEEAREAARSLGAHLLEEPHPHDFLDRLRGARWAHVAAHCSFRPDAPLLSTVHLRAGPVTVADVMAHLRPAPAVVVLSGCETASHRLLPGDELVGFARAWLHAGARTLILSLWPVEDSAACYLMREFYAALGRGERPAAALRRSGLSLRDRGAHPLHWAAFVLVGDPDPPVQTAAAPRSFG